MTTVRLGFAKNTRSYAIFGWIIQAFERYTSGLDASHSFIQIYMDDSESMIVESVWPVGKVKPVGKYFSKYEIVDSYDFVIDQPASDVLKWCRENIEGKRYSFSQNIFIGAIGLVMKLFNLANWNLEKKEFNGRESLNCTEAQIMFLAKFFNVYPTEGFDNFSVGESRDLVKAVWALKGGNK